METQNIKGRTTESVEEDAMGDPGVVSAAPKVEHYDNASYERLRHFGELIGLIETLQLPKASVIEEKVVNKKLLS